MKKYLVVIEKTKTGYSAYSPDLAGCVAAAKTRDAVEKRMQQAVLFHLEGLRAEHRRLPSSHSYSTYLEVVS